MMLRLVFLFLIVALAIAPQQAPTKAAGEDGFASLINEPDLTEWDGNRHAWKLDDGVLTGRSDGSSPAILVVSGREFGDFELRFEARVHRGAVRVKMHGPGPGPLGVALEINSATVEWFSNDASSFVVAYNRPDDIPPAVRHAGCERPLEQRRTSGGKELRPVAPLALGVRAFSALPRHFLRSWTTDEASSGTEDSSSQKVSPGWGSSYRHPPRAEMPSGPVLLPSTPPFPPLVLRCSSGRTAGGSLYSYQCVSDPSGRL